MSKERTECCEKCACNCGAEHKYWLHFKENECSVCPCHSPASQEKECTCNQYGRPNKAPEYHWPDCPLAPQDTEGWEKRFEREFYFGIEDADNDHVVSRPERLKQFIRQELASQRAHDRDELRRKVEELLGKNETKSDEYALGRDKGYKDVLALLQSPKE